MKIKIALAIAAWLLCCSAFGQSAGPKLAITQVNVIPLHTEMVLENQTVLISNGKIESIGPTTKIPKGYQKIDGKGKYLLPGFADMHAHLPGPEATDYPLQQYLLSNLSQGVTTLRAMRGNKEQLAIRKAVQEKELLGPKLYISSPAIRKTDSLSLGNAAQTFRQWKTAGYDFIKVLSIDTALYDALVPLMQQEGLALAGHSPDHHLARAVQAGQRSIEHIDPVVRSYFKDSVETLSLFERMNEKDIFHCPDLYWYYINGSLMSLDELKSSRGLALVPEAVKSQWIKGREEWLADTAKAERYKAYYSQLIAAYQPLLKKMEEAGVKLLISPGDGDFIVPGYSMVEEMKLFAQAGIRPYQILRAASANAADFFQESQQWGTLEKGKEANMVLLSDNPLQNIENVTKVEGVVVQGKWYTKEALEQLSKQ